jgi:glyoxylase-like metal-dependent hydrolase (beta-lactamase superfamily II)
MEFFNVGSKDVNIYLLHSGLKRLLIDTGFPNTLNNLGRQLRAIGFKISEIDYLLVTHFHIDHAGAVQELKENGVKFLIPDVQKNFINQMEHMAAGKWKYKNLEIHDNIEFSIDESKNILKNAGFNGQIIPTPGHTDDSISLVLDSGEAFTGDLMAEHLIMPDDLVSLSSWKKLKAYNARIIYPGHGRTYVLNSDK